MRDTPDQYRVPNYPEFPDCCSSRHPSRTQRGIAPSFNRVVKPQRLDLGGRELDWRKAAGGDGVGHVPAILTDS
jgi:hypothetical protein